MNSSVTDLDRDGSPSAREPVVEHTGDVFQSLFERSADAIWLLDPQTGVFVDCNQAAVELIGAESKQQVLNSRPEDLSPPFQPDGTRSADKSAEIIAIFERQKTYRFEWVMRRLDGREVPIEVSSTEVHMGGKRINIVISRDISERKKAERELLELTQALERRVTERTAELSASETRFRAMVEHSPEAIVVYSADTGRFLFGNQHACDLYGVPMSKLPELTPADVSPEFQPDGRPTSEVACEKVAEVLAGKTSVFEWMHQRADGQLIPTEVRLLHLAADGQNLIRASIIDNTERKRAEAALAESEARFRVAFEASPILIVIARMSDQKYVLVNDAFVKWSGCTREELLGKDSTESGIWESEDERDAVWADLRHDGSIRERECHFRNRRGDRTTMLISFEVIQINHAPHVLAMGLDISARKQAEAESRASEARLRESEARFSAAFQSSPVFTSILSKGDGKYVLVNDAFVNWLGCPREEIIGRSPTELGMWESLVERDAITEEVLHCGFIRHKECRWRNRRGELFTILLSVETILVDNVPHFLCLDLDITQRKKAEVEMLKSLASEKELSQLKSNFISMVSHEFRTPLGIIQSSAELLRDFYQKMPPPERDEQLASIIRNTRRMAGMMEEVLVLSRLDAGKLEFQPVALDLDVFCNRVVDEVLSATNRRCPIELSLHSIPTEAQADERLLGHIFTNLLSNAVKYSEAGATVQFTVERHGLDLICAIRDEGIGIPEADQEQLFKAFHRGSNVGTRPGTGLGLMLVKRCADLHGGSVQVNSKTGEGTTVVVRFPIF